MVSGHCIDYWNTVFMVQKVTDKTKKHQTFITLYDGDGQCWLLESGASESWVVKKSSNKITLCNSPIVQRNKQLQQ